MSCPFCDAQEKDLYFKYTNCYNSPKLYTNVSPDRPTLIARTYTYVGWMTCAECKAEGPIVCGDDLGGLPKAALLRWNEKTVQQAANIPDTGVFKTPEWLREQLRERAPEKPLMEKLIELVISNQTLTNHKLDELLQAKPDTVYITASGLEVQEVVATALAAVRNELALVKDARDRADKEVGRLRDEMHSKDNEILRLKRELQSLQPQATANTGGEIGNLGSEWI